MENKNDDCPKCHGRRIVKGEYGTSICTECLARGRFDQDDKRNIQPRNATIKSNSGGN